MRQRNQLQIKWSPWCHKHSQNFLRNPQSLQYLEDQGWSHHQCYRWHPQCCFIPHRSHQWCQKGRHLNLQQRCRRLQRCHQRHRWLHRSRRRIQERWIQLRPSCSNHQQILVTRNCLENDQALYGPYGCSCPINPRRWRQCWCRRKTRPIIGYLERKCWSRLVSLWREERPSPRWIHPPKGPLCCQQCQTWNLKECLSRQDWTPHWNHCSPNRR